jgi:hypothetical protein
MNSCDKKLSRSMLWDLDEAREPIQSEVLRGDAEDQTLASPRRNSCGSRSTGQTISVVTVAYASNVHYASRGTLLYYGLSDATRMNCRVLLLTEYRYRLGTRVMAVTTRAACPLCPGREGCRDPDCKIFSHLRQPFATVPPSPVAVGAHCSRG